MSLYIGLISGTSMDGIDAALVDIQDEKLRVDSFLTYPYSSDLRDKLSDFIKPDYRASLHEMATLNIEVGNAFAAAANELLSTAGVASSDVTALGSHGQTLCHSPNSSPPYSIQTGDGATIAAKTKITTVENFRGLDIACGGQGAPLVPGFHEWMFREKSETRVVLNIGGIANITVLPKDIEHNIFGYDTGPGNCLMDEWCGSHLGEPFDRDGQWARSGQSNDNLLKILLADEYFGLGHPKSTGREYFNLLWLQKALENFSFDSLPPEDVQSTLLTLTAKSISAELENLVPDCETLIVCGGGADNPALVSEIRANTQNCSVVTSDKYGLDSSIVEACAFAWLAYCRQTLHAVALTTREEPTAQIIGAVHIAPR